MTINRLFGLLLQLTMYPVILYWLLPLFAFNNGRNTNLVLWQHNYWYVASQILFIIYCGVMFISFCIYLHYNNERSAAIVLAPSYIWENYWKDVNNNLD